MRAWFVVINPPRSPWHDCRSSNRLTILSDGFLEREAGSKETPEGGDNRQPRFGFGSVISFVNGRRGPD